MPPPLNRRARAMADKCLGCSECRGASHHWLADPTPEHDYVCKHCDQLGMTCDCCFGDGCPHCSGEGVIPFTPPPATEQVCPKCGAAALKLGSQEGQAWACGSSNLHGVFVESKDCLRRQLHQVRAALLPFADVNIGPDCGGPVVGVNLRREAVLEARKVMREGKP